MATRTAALSAYRNALRATKLAFANDMPVLVGARNKIRDGFIENKHLQDEEKIAEQIKHINEVTQFLTKNIVQGRMQEDGKYFLNFHEKTELGDNDSIKQSKTEMGSLSGKKGSCIKR